MKEYKISMIDGTEGTLKETDKLKAFKSDNYNYLFLKTNGTFLRWGNAEKVEESKQVSVSKSDLELYKIWIALWGKVSLSQFVADLKTDGDINKSVPELVDMEISELCEGVPGVGPCRFCYKSNVGNKGDNMDFETFKRVFHKLPKTITQIAFGIGTIRLQPDLWKIFDYCRQNGVIPNVTVNGDVNDEDIDNIAKYCGACAVSVYDSELTYNTIKKLTDKGMKQINIHYMISEETYEGALKLLNDRLNDDRLKNLNAIVLLSLKPKGRAANGKFTKLSQEKFDTLFEFALKNNIGCGFDSCSAAKAFTYISDKPHYSSIGTYIEPCESSIYSAYINVRGDYFPCSFSEGAKNWENGISVLECSDFMKDIWFNKRTTEFSKGVKKCRECNVGCPIYEI
jgi:MoaA/NifB/PqqE/SkfB family radical SAM enzyme